MIFLKYDENPSLNYSHIIYLILYFIMASHYFVYYLVGLIFSQERSLKFLQDYFFTNVI